MKNYYRVMLGRKSVHAPACFAGNFIGVDFGIDQDLSGQLPTEWREFNQKFIPIFLDKHPEKTKIGAGLACGAVWTVTKGILRGDVVLCPDGAGIESPPNRRQFNLHGLHARLIAAGEVPISHLKFRPTV